MLEIGIFLTYPVAVGYSTVHSSYGSCYHVSYLVWSIVPGIGNVGPVHNKHDSIINCNKYNNTGISSDGHIRKV